MKYTFITYDNNDEIKAELMECITDILSSYGCLSIKMPIYTCLNELLVNAIKANYKNLYFEEYAPQNNALDIIPYHKALKLFKLEMSTQRIDYLLNMAKEKDVKAEIELSVYEQNVFCMQVINPAEMTEVEQDNVCRKIECAQKYETLSEYFMQGINDPNKEGGGLGIIFIIMMLKSFGLDASFFSISSQNGYTTSRIMIPLNEKTAHFYKENSAEK